MMSKIFKGTKTDFSYLVGMSLQGRMPWETLASLLKDLAPTLEETREVISILLKELEVLQSSLQEKELEKFPKQRMGDDIQDQNDIVTLETSNDADEHDESLIETESLEEDIEVFVRKLGMKLVDFLHRCKFQHNSKTSLAVDCFHREK